MTLRWGPEFNEYRQLIYKSRQRERAARWDAYIQVVFFCVTGLWAFWWTLLHWNPLGAWILGGAAAMNATLFVTSARQIIRERTLQAQISKQCERLWESLNYAKIHRNGWHGGDSTSAGQTLLQ